MKKISGGEKTNLSSHPRQEPGGDVGPVSSTEGPGDGGEDAGEDHGQEDGSPPEPVRGEPDQGAAQEQSDHVETAGQPNLPLVPAHQRPLSHSCARHLELLPHPDLVLLLLAQAGDLGRQEVLRTVRTEVWRVQGAVVTALAANVLRQVTMLCSGTTVIVIFALEWKTIFRF